MCLRSPPHSSLRIPLPHAARASVTICAENHSLLSTLSRGRPTSFLYCRIECSQWNGNYSLFRARYPGRQRFSFFLRCLSKPPAPMEQAPSSDRGLCGIRFSLSGDGWKPLVLSQTFPSVKVTLCGFMGPRTSLPQMAALFSSALPAGSFYGEGCPCKGRFSS